MGQQNGPRNVNLREIGTADAKERQRRCGNHDGEKRKIRDYLGGK